jgi:hypothetical protein
LNCTVKGTRNENLGDSKPDGRVVLKSESPAAGANKPPRVPKADLVENKVVIP